MAAYAHCFKVQNKFKMESKATQVFWLLGFIVDFGLLSTVVPIAQG